MKLIPIAALLLLLTACTTQPSAENADADPFDLQDPIKPVNEVVFGFNLGADRHVIKPVADAYHEVPDLARSGVSNFLSNLHEPANVVNNVLQLDIDAAARSFWRFTLNTTFGLAGLRDFAGENGLPSKDTDFGKTLGRYGIGEGGYVVLPLLGPSTTRDTAGKAVDWFLDPVGWVLTTPQSIAQGVSDGLVAREENDAIVDQLYYQSLEPYSATRASYLQHQAFDWK